MAVRSRRQAVKAFGTRQLSQAVEAMEPRRLFAISVANPIADVSVVTGAPSTTVPLTGVFATSGVTVQGTIVRLQMQAGNTGAYRDLYIELFDQAVAGRSAAPNSVANFLSYVNSGAYANSFFHRATNFSGDDVGSSATFLQGGGFNIQSTTGDDVSGTIPTNAPINIEWAADRPNVAGTISYARTTALNSATSGFFFNVVNNTGFDQAPSNIYTVFGHVVGNGQQVLNDYAALDRIDASSANGAFQTLPVTSTSGIGISNYLDRVLAVRAASVVASPASSVGYTVTSSNAAVAGVTVDANNNVVLTYGAAGTATITVAGTDLSGAATTETFTVTLTAPPVFTVTVDGAPVANGQTTPINFGTVSAGGTAPTKSFTFTNTSSSAVAPGAVTVPEGYILVTGLPTTIEAGGSATFVVALNASDAGVNSGNIIVAGAQAFSIPVTGAVGVVPGVIAVGLNGTTLPSGQATPLNFGVASAGSAQTRSFTVTNSGESVVTLSPATVGAGFTITQQLPTSLAGGQSATLIVAVDTASVGVKAATLTILNDGTSGPFTAALAATVARAVTLNADLSSLTYTDADGTVAKYTFKGPGSVVIALLNGDEPIISGKSATVGGTNVSLETIAFDGATTAATSLTSSAKGGNGVATVSQLTAPAVVGALKLTGVLLTNASATAGVSSLTVSGLRGTVAMLINSGAVVVGDVTGATAGFTGNLKSFAADSVAASSTLTLANPDKVTVKGAIDNTTLNITGDTKSVTAASLTGTTLVAAGLLQTFSTKGAVTNSTLDIAGPVSTFKALSLVGSTVEIGHTGSTAVDPVPANFTGTSTVKSFTLSSKTGAFSRSSLFVGNAGALNLGTFTTDSADQSRIALITAKTISGTGTSKFSLKSVAGAAYDVTTAPTAAGLPASRLAIIIASTPAT